MEAHNLTMKMMEKIAKAALNCEGWANLYWIKTGGRSRRVICETNGSVVLRNLYKRENFLAIFCGGSSMIIGQLLVDQPTSFNPRRNSLSHYVKKWFKEPRLQP
jgi:hypothetical protein